MTMNRDDILRMAQQAGLGNLLPAQFGLPEIWHGRQLSEIERFAEMVAAHVRQERAKEIEELRGKANYAEKWRGLATAKNGDGRIVAEIEQEKRDAVLAEREACAKVCRDWGMERVENWKHDPEMRDDAMARAHDAECCRARILKRGEG